VGRTWNEFWKFYKCNLHFVLAYWKLYVCILIWKWLSKLHALTTGRVCLQNSLVTEHSFRPKFAVAKRIQWTCNRWVMSFMNPYTGLYVRQAVSCWSNFQREQTQRTRCSRQGLKMNLTTQIFLFIPGEWCIVHLYLETKGKWLESISLV